MEAFTNSGKWGWHLCLGLAAGAFCAAPLRAQPLPSQLWPMQGCDELKTLAVGIAAAQKKEEAARAATLRLHDPKKTGRPVPEKPLDLRSDSDIALVPGGVLSHSNAPRTANQVMAALQGEINRHQPFLTQAPALLATARDYRERIKPLRAAMERKQKEKQEAEARLRQSQIQIAQLANNAEYKARSNEAAALEKILRGKIAVPGRLGLSLGSADGVASALTTVDDQPAGRLQELYLTSRLIQTLRPQITALQNRIPELRREADDLFGTALENKKRNELNRAINELQTLEQQIKAERERLRSEVSDDLSRLLTARSAMAKLEPAALQADQRKLRQLETETARLALQINTLEQEALKKLTDANRKIPNAPTLNLNQLEDESADGLSSRGAISELERVIPLYQKFIEGHQARLKAVRDYVAWDKADVELRRAYDEKKQLQKKREGVIASGAATLTTAQNEARLARDAFAADLKNRQQQINTARTLLSQWNAIAARRTAIENKAKTLKRQRAFFPLQRAQLLKEWEPHRLVRNQMLSNKRDGATLARMLNTAIPTKVKEAQRALIQSLTLSRESLKPFDCAEFPQAQAYGAALAKAIETLNKSLQKPNDELVDGPPAVALPIPDLQLPAADAMRGHVATGVLTLPGKIIKTYKVVKTVFSRQLVNKQPETGEENGFKSSLVLQVQEPGYDSTTTLSVTAPSHIKGNEEFEIAAKVAAQWTLKNATYNLNVGLLVAGTPDQKALEGDLKPGGHTLNISNTQKRSFRNADGFLRKWKENGVVYRSFSVSFHSGVVQGLSGGTMTFIYREE